MRIVTQRSRCSWATPAERVPRRGWGGGRTEPLAEGNWPIISASPLPYFPHSQVPAEMTRRQMNEVTADFVRAAEMSDQAGFDSLELRMAERDLLARFL